MNEFHLNATGVWWSQRIGAGSVRSTRRGEASGPGCWGQLAASGRENGRFASISSDQKEPVGLTVVDGTTKNVDALDIRAQYVVTLFASAWGAVDGSESRLLKVCLYCPLWH